MMAESIVNILKTNNITVSFVAQESGLDVAQVSAALKRPVATWSIQILNAFADALAERPGELLDQLQDLPFQLQTDDDHLMIQRVRFSNRSSYQQVRFAVESNVLEGWKPTAKEIRLLKEAAETPDTEMQTEIERLFGDKND
ncbi:helix-turn-helix transcriptional regulator [uncultured Limosilactobacillus sp.]|nr:helix-turn-helix transcriptional regulator [uncultured Limosilactobacillus sp.]